MTTTTNVARMDATPGDRYVFGREVATVQTVPRTSSNPGVIGAVKLGCRTVRGFPQFDSAAVDCGAVELNELDFRRTSFPPDESVTIYGWPRWPAHQCALELGHSSSDLPTDLYGAISARLFSLFVGYVVL